MATVSDPRPRAKRTRRPAADPSPVVIPPDHARSPGRSIPQPTARIEEGWQPGGRAAVAEAPAPARPVERHGKCSLTLRIGGSEYRLSPAVAGPPIEVVWTLRKIGSVPPAGPVAYAVASDGLDVHCTCPDHEINGAQCKHIGALVALRLMPRPVAAKGGAR